MAHPTHPGTTGLEGFVKYLLNENMKKGMAFEETNKLICISFIKARATFWAIKTVVTWPLMAYESEIMPS